MIKHTLVIDDFSVNNVKKGKVSFYNCSSGKSLSKSMGVKQCTMPNKNNVYGSFNMPSAITDIQEIYPYRQYSSSSKVTSYKLMMIGSDNKLYVGSLYSTSFNFTAVAGMLFEKTPICFFGYVKNAADSLVIASPTKIVIMRTGSTNFTITTAPEITSICVSDGVLFCTVNNPAYKIWYNKDLALEALGNVDGVSGYLYFEDDLGYAKKIIALNEDVYVFREYGISKINKYKDEMNIDQVYKSNTMIYYNTVSLCGNKIFFMTQEGLYSFNGNVVKKIDINITDILESLTNAKAVSLGEKYYVSLKLNYNDDKTILCEEGTCANNALLIVDTNDYSCQIIRGIDVKAICPLKTDRHEKVLAILSGVGSLKICEIVQDADYFADNLPKNWQKTEIFEDYSKKIVTKLQVKADEGITFTLNLDGVKKQFTTTKSGVNEFHFKHACNQCGVEISSDNQNFNIQKVEIEYYDC